MVLCFAKSLRLVDYGAHNNFCAVLQVCIAELPFRQHISGGTTAVAVIGCRRCYRLPLAIDLLGALGSNDYPTMLRGGYRHALTTETNLIVIIDNLEVTGERGVMPTIDVLNGWHLDEITIIHNGLQLQPRCGSNTSTADIFVISIRLNFDLSSKMLQLLLLIFILFVC